MEGKGVGPGRARKTKFSQLGAARLGSARKTAGRARFAARADGAGSCGLLRETGAANISNVSVPKRPAAAKGQTFFMSLPLVVPGSLVRAQSPQLYALFWGKPARLWKPPPRSRGMQHPKNCPQKTKTRSARAAHRYNGMMSDGSRSIPRAVFISRA